MRFRHIGAFVLALAASAVASQSDALPIDSYGIRGGMTLSRIHGEYGDLVANERRADGAGVWYVRLGRGAFSLQPELAWAAKGGRSRHMIETTVYAPDPGPGAARIGLDVRIHYVELPLLVRWSPARRGALRPYVVTGPAVAFKLSSEASLKSGAATARAPHSGMRMANIFERAGTISGPNYRAVDLGLVGGGGITIGAGAFRAVLDARYEYGARSVIGAMDGHNGTWLFTAGIDLR